MSNSGTATPAQSAPITFTAEQQERISEIVQDRLSRAHRELKGQVEELKERNAALEGHSAQDGNSNAEITRLTAELEKSQSEMEELRKRSVIDTALRGIDWFDSSEVAESIKARVRFDKGKGRYVVLNHSGVPTMNSSLEAMTVDEYLRDHAAKKPWLVRPKEDGVGRADRGSDANLVKRLFGKGSDSAFANKFARENIAEYRRLRQVAVEQKVI